MTSDGTPWSLMTLTPVGTSNSSAAASPLFTAASSFLSARMYFIIALHIELRDTGLGMSADRNPRPECSFRSTHTPGRRIHCNLVNSRHHHPIPQCSRQEANWGKPPPVDRTITKLAAIDGIALCRQKPTVDPHDRTRNTQ